MTTGSTFNPRAFVGSRKNTDDKPKRRRGFDYSKVLLPKVQIPFQITDVLEVEDKTYGKPQDNFLKIQFVIIGIVPGAENATTKAEQDAFCARGHGIRRSVEVRPACTPPGRRKNKETGKYETLNPSGLYVALCELINNGEPLTDEQMGLLSDAELKAFMAKWNAENPDDKVSDLREAQDLHSSIVVGQHLERIKAEKPFVYVTPAIKTKVNERGQAIKDQETGKPIQYNRFPKIDALIPPELVEALGLVPYRPYPDPRTLGEPTILCERCETRELHGYENYEGTWVTQDEAIAHAVENYGGKFCGLCIRDIKAEAENGSDDGDF